MADKLIVGQEYKKQFALHVLLGLPEDIKIQGYWSNGYVSHEGISCIFANVGIPGRNGYDYKNEWKNEKTLYWQAIQSSHVGQQKIKNLLLEGKTHIFTREDKNKGTFTYHGVGNAQVISESGPVEIIWTFDDMLSSEQVKNDIDFEQEDHYENGKEGARKRYYSTRYERNQTLREQAIRIHGTSCMVCGFNFFDVYGERGRNYIEVHHIKPLHELDEIVTVKPGTDLAVLCSNCHRMIHRRMKNTLSIEELKGMLRST